MLICRRAKDTSSTRRVRSRRNHGRPRHSVAGRLLQHSRDSCRGGHPGKYELMCLTEGHDHRPTCSIDAGASENVMCESLAPQYSSMPSAGSQVGVRHPAANSATMPNRGEKDVNFKTFEGHNCRLKMQVVGVQRTPHQRIEDMRCRTEGGAYQGGWLNPKRGDRTDNTIP